MKTVASICSGGGGLDYGFSKYFEIIFAIDNDPYAVKTYQKNVNQHIILGNVRQAIDGIPKSDLLIGGIPCVGFSLAGKKKGLNDQRSKVFYDFLDILHRNQPKVIVLENVANLAVINCGETLNYIINAIKLFGYKIYHQILDSQYFNVPQRRRRLFIVGFHEDYFNNESFSFPKGKLLNHTLQDLLDDFVPAKYFLTHKTKEYVLNFSSKSDNSIEKTAINPTIAKTLLTNSDSANKYTINNYVTDNKNAVYHKKSNLRKLTPNECRKLQGFPETWQQVTSDRQAYKIYGNAVTVSVATELAREIKKYILLNKKLKSN